MTRLSMLLCMPALAACLFPATAMAETTLVSSTPAADATVTKPKTIELTFNEKLIPDQSGFDLVMTGMPGMSNHAPMKISGFATAFAPDGKSLVATLPRALPAGTYTLSWHAAAVDEPRVEGKYDFEVK